MSIFVKKNAFYQVIGNSQFRNLWLGQVFSQIAINMMAFILMVRVYQATGSNTAVSVLLFFVGIPAVILGMTAGVLVDRWEKRKVLFWCNLLRAFLTIGFLVSSETTAWVYFLAFAASAVTQFFIPAEAPTIPKIVPETLLITANSLFTFTFISSLATGYLLAGPVIRVFGVNNAFLLVSALFFLAALFVRRLPSFPSANREEGSKIFADFTEGLSFIKKNSLVKEAIFILVSSQTIVAVLSALAPGFADKILKIEIADASFLVLAPAVLGMILGAFFVGQFGSRFNNFVNMGIFGTGSALLAVSLCYRINNAGGFLNFDILYLAILALFFLGIANSFLSVPANTSLQANTNEQLRGRVYGILTGLGGGLSILPVLAVGILADLFGVGKVIAAIGIIVLGYGVVKIKNQKWGNVFIFNF